MRKLAFYARLAMQNLFKNRLFYGPNLLACTLCAALFYIVRFLAYSDMVPQMRGAYYVSFMLELGTIVLAVVMMSILIYANGFIMKRRQKELGLYNILGMEKRQVAHVLILESMFLGLGSLVLGLGTGVLFSKLALMGLLRLLKFEIPLGFEVSVQGMVETALVMGAVFLLLILRNLWILHLSRPVDLLRSGNVGEAEPHSRRFMAAMGVLFLGAGYTIAVTIRNPLGAFLLFFVAVLLVIVGNYCLFTATSVVILKALRKNKAFYYKPRHFTAVSGMLYRMKQNAKGMHNICILATMLLVTISTTVCMYAGSEEALRRMYPDEIALSGHLDTGEEALTGDFDALEAAYRRAVEQAGLSADTLTGRLQLSFAAGRKGDSFSLYVENDLGMSVYSLDFMVLEDYNRQVGLAADDSLLETAGEHLLNGRQALSYCRIRKIDSDFQRTGRQQRIIESAAEKLMQMKLFDLLKLAVTLLDEVETDLTLADLAPLAPLLGCETLDIQGAHVPFDGAYADETIGGMMVLTPDLSSNRSQLSRFLEGD